MFAIRDGVLRCVDISACTSLQVLQIATTGRAVLELRWDFAFRARLRCAVSACLQMLHCYPCGYLPAGEACSSIRWAGMLLYELALSRLLLAHPPPGGRTCLRCKLVPSNAPAGRLRVGANLNNRTMRAALAGWVARCLHGSLVAGPALASRT